MTKPPNSHTSGAPEPSASSFTVIRATSTAEDLVLRAIVELHGRKLIDQVAPSEFLRDPAAYLLLALDGGRVIGSLIGCALRPPHRLQPQFLLYEIDVRSERRNQGIGTALVEAFIAEARAAGSFEVWALTNQSNEAAMAMYSRCGMTRPNRDDAMLSLVLEDNTH